MNPLALPGVTIVIPAYNYAEFLAEAIDSALAQTHPVIEVLVVDDGSTDETPHLLEGYADRIRVVTQDNLGLAAARNTGLREASHELVAFLDADDRLLPHMVGLLQGTLSLVGQEYALVAACHAYIDASGRPLAKAMRGPAETGEITRADLLLANRFAPSTVLARRDALLALGGFDEDLPRVEDRDLWLRLAEHRRLMQVPDALAEVRLHFRNMSKDADLMCACLHEVLANALARQPVSPALERRCRASCHHDCAWMRHDARQRGRAVADELRSLALAPGPALRRDLGQAHGFRLRALLRFLLGLHDQPKTLAE